MMDYTLMVVGSGALVLGSVSGALGCFALLRKQSLLGDAISHAALPGLCIAFLLTWTKSPWVLALGALLAGWLGVLIVSGLRRFTPLKDDAALGFILSVFFGLGMVLMSIIQRLPTAHQSGLGTYLFGSAATMLLSDVIMMLVLGGGVMLLLCLLWPQFKVFTFDPAFARSLGLKTFVLEIVLTGMIVVAIVIGLQSVGVVLMSALLVAPAAAARQWTHRLGHMVCLAAGIGAFSAVSGAWMSSLISRLPTGPIIVLILSAVVLFSLVWRIRKGQI